MSSARIVRGLNAIAQPPRRAVVTVGVFDGVHLAHQQLIRSTIRLARRLNGTSVVVTFDPDPQAVLDPAHPQPALMPLEARLEHLESLGVDRIWVIPFTRRFARTAAEEFVRRLLIRRLRAAALVVGETFVFGRNRQGNTAVLQSVGPPHGMRIVPVRLIRSGRKPVSSSRIRRLIERGRLTQARRLLSRPPALYGVVVRGAGRGRRLGIPTANIRLIPQVLPPRGVYAVVVRIARHSRARRGVSPPPISVRSKRTATRFQLACGEQIGGGLMNLGVRPTFGPGPLVCEVHLLEFSGMLLGRSVSVSLLKRLRRERRFSSPQVLIRQVRRDMVRARAIFARLT